jgi:uroporphyrinogen decarboxylase
MNKRLLDALHYRNEGRPPIWLMRQAGRYMPEYRALREKYSFLDLCHHPELICEVALQPLKRYELDAAILFSDILVLFEPFGVKVAFEEDIGPVIETRRILPKIDSHQVCASLDYVKQGIHLLKKELRVPLLGFSGAPFTLASYLIEGRTSRDWMKTKEMMFRNPKEFHALLDSLADAAIDYLNMQIEAGVDAIQIFDSWAHSLALPQFKEFSLRYLKKIVDALPPHIPKIVFCRGSSFFASELVTINPTCISVDWNADISKLNIPAPIAIQGNLDPAVLMGDAQTIQRETRHLLLSMEKHPGYIFNLGHGITPNIKPEAVATLVETVRNFEPCLSS